MASQPGFFNLQNFTDLGAFSVGGRLYTYAPGTTTHKTAYTDAAAAVPHTYTSDGSGGQYIAMNARGELPAPLFLSSGGYDVTYKTAAGATVWTRRAVGSEDEATAADTAVRADLASTSDAAKGDALLGVKRTAAGAVASTQHLVNESRVFDAAADFGVVFDGTTVNNAAMQAAVTAAAGNVLVIRKGASFARLTARITVPANTTIWLQDAELKWTATDTTGTAFLGTSTRAGFEVTGDNVSFIGRGTLRGPSVATYVGNEVAIYCKGASSASRRKNLKIDGRIEVVDWGSYGILAQYVSGFTARDVYVHDCAFTGLQLMSCDKIRIKDGEYGGFTPGTAGNAYGVSLSHDSTNYASNPNPGQKSATEPFCWDAVIDGVTVYDVPIWQGIDAHGGYEIHIRNCNVYNCLMGIAVASSSGSAAAYAGWSNTITGNTINSLKRDGTASSASASGRVGIQINGGATQKNDSILVSGNVIEGYGDTALSGASISATNTANVHVANNTIRNWYGRGIYSAAGGGVIDNNLFGPVASATNSICIYLDTTTDHWKVTGNKHRPLTGTMASEGLRVASGNPRALVSGNEFEATATGYPGLSGSMTMGASDIPPEVSVTNAPTTVSVAACGKAPRVIIRLAPSGPHTITSFDGAYIGQMITLYAATSTATTFDRSSSALAGGANWVSTQYDTLNLLCVDTSGTKFVELGRSANS